MDAHKWFDKRIEHLKTDPEFLSEQLILKLNEEICRVMEEQGISRAELARRLGVQRQFITKLLNGMPNLTLITLVKIATALGVQVEFKVVCSNRTGSRRRSNAATAVKTSPEKSRTIIKT